MAIGGQQGQGVTVIFRNGRVVEFGGVAAAVFKNGHVVGFEGARCLFIYNSVPQKYDVDVPNISKQYVTNFVTKKMIELSEAFLVLGSNVMGPMGYDLIPFGTKAEATRFATENDGKWIVQLHEVDRNLTARPQDGQTDSLGKESQKLPEKSEKEPKRNKKESPAAEPRYPAPRTGPSGHHMH
jgi:nitrous oxide reductase accessory protein NosL